MQCGTQTLIEWIGNSLFSCASKPVVQKGNITEPGQTSGLVFGTVQEGGHGQDPILDVKLSSRYFTPLY